MQARLKRVQLPIAKSRRADFDIAEIVVLAPIQYSYCIEHPSSMAPAVPTDLTPSSLPSIEPGAVATLAPEPEEFTLSVDDSAFDIDDPDRAYDSQLPYEERIDLAYKACLGKPRFSEPLRLQKNSVLLNLHFIDEQS